MKLTILQKQVLARVALTTLRGHWYRAGSSGERVTLASLHTHRLCVRRAWRGAEGERDAAHEYQAVKLVLDIVKEINHSRGTLSCP